MPRFQQEMESLQVRLKGGVGLGHVDREALVGLEPFVVQSGMTSLHQLEPVLTDFLHSVLLFLQH
jgi:hypothetical protein